MWMNAASKKLPGCSASPIKPPNLYSRAPKWPFEPPSATRTTTMQFPDDVLESNTARLLEAGMGGEARIDAKLRQSMRQRLVSELNTQTAIPPFPEKALGVLTTFTLLVVLAILMQLGQGQALTFENDLWPLVILLLLPNLALLTIASIVIIFHRRKA